MANNVGVFTTRATAGPIAFGPDPGDSFFIGLLAERGPSDVPTLISSFTRFLAAFGGATPFAAETKYSTGYEVLRRFFDKGGRRAYMTRIVGATAVEAYTNLVDRAGAPLDTLRVYGKGEGTWANTYYVKIEEGTKADTFKISLYDGDPATTGELVPGESYDNLKMTSSYIAAVNNQSDYMRLEDLASATAAPDNRPATGNFIIGTDQAGVDDNAPAAAVIVGTEVAGVKTGLMVFRDSTYGRGFVCAPDLDDDSTVRDELIAQTELYYRVPLFSSLAAATPATAKTDKGTAVAFNGGYFFPRCLVEDALTEELKPTPVVGHIAADWIKAIARKGPGKAPAGRDFKIDFCEGIEKQSNGQPLIDATVAEDLLANGVNPIYDRDGGGPKVWGARSTSDDTSWQYLHAGYIWCLIASRVQDALDALVYEVADDLFFSQIEQGIRAFLSDLHRDGAFNGAIPLPSEDYDPNIHAFSVVCNEDLLSASDLNNGIVRAEIEFKPALTAETILVTVAKRNN